MKSEKRLPSLALCLIMDGIGMATYIFPALGETFDLAWAPISGFAFYLIFGGRLGVFGGTFDFLEELIPFTDIIPSFTIAWFIRKNAIEKQSLKNKGMPS
ncbi:MAG: hypothetical protein HY305_01665 [Sphingobacteriales bacterium]|nr:hypothetical protein [Sphingobacteriales bacterium]